jgi:hypothetical protein
LLKKAHIAPKKIEQNEEKKHNRAENRQKRETTIQPHTQKRPEMVLLEETLFFLLQRKRAKREFVRKKNK